MSHENERWIFSGSSIHVQKDSQFQAPVQKTRKELAMRSISVNPHDALHFSSVFTISATDLDQIKELISELISNSHRIIQDSGTEELACLCFDIFRVV